MTQEDKELLLKDLCARVPYHPKGHVANACNGAECDEWLTCATFTMFTDVTNNCRLYLRPRSEISNLISAKKFSSLGGIELIDWYNANHIDYRGLIEKNLAIEVTKENNPYEDIKLWNGTYQKPL